MSSPNLGTIEPIKKEFSWKWLFIKAAGFGTGSALILFIVVGTWWWYSSRPKPDPAWNATAIQAKPADVFLNTGDKLVVTFTYALENTTQKDYSMPASRSVMLKLPLDKGYSSEEGATLDVNCSFQPETK